MRFPSNCQLAALRLWLKTRFRGYWWARRSLHFAGVVVHSGVAYHGPFRRLFVAEFVPPKSALWTWQNMLVLFFGRYRVWEFRLVRCRRFSTVAQLEAYLQSQGVKE
ncbi:MAG: hypothetical protein KDG55_06015 [Rhodocyclaceae bacterium]|nr:hypothetical protein [Rhodocyclaceae bacterium]